MVETDITKGLKSEEEREEALKQELEKAEEIIEKGAAISEKSDTRNLTLMIIGVLVLFGVLFGGFFWYNNTIGAPKTIDELHIMNMNGELDETEGMMYNGHSFVKYDNMWWTVVGVEQKEVTHPFHNSPKDVANISITGEFNSDTFNKNQDVYISTDPTIVDKYYSLGAIALSVSVGKGINKHPVGAWSKSYEYNPGNVSIVTCDNANGRAVVEFVQDNRTAVELDGTCMRVIGKSRESLRAMERLLYRWYRIII